VEGEDIPGAGEDESPIASALDAEEVAMALDANDGDEPMAIENEG
jgi:hypothetical protein